MLHYSLGSCFQTTPSLILASFQEDFLFSLRLFSKTLTSPSDKCRRCVEGVSLYSWDDFGVDGFMEVHGLS